MTTVYFVRHAEPNYSNHDDLSRELSAKGLEDRNLVTKFLENKNIDVILSAPLKGRMIRLHYLQRQKVWKYR